MSKDFPVPTEYTPPDGLPAMGTMEPALPPLEEEEASGAVALQRVLAALVRYKWLVLALAVLGTVAGVAVSRFVESEYVAESTIWIEVGDRMGGDRGGPIRSGGLLQSYAWIELLRSYAVLDHVVRSERLYLEYNARDRQAMESFRLASRFRPGAYVLRVAPGKQTFELRTAEGMSLQQGSVGEPIGAEIGFEWTPKASQLREGEIEFQVAVPRDAARELNDEVRTQMAPEGNFLRLELRGEDRRRIASVLNAVADRYVDVAAELKSAKLKELARILEQQLAYAERNLRDAEIALEGFRVQTITLPTDRSTPVVPGLESTRDPVFDNFFGMRIEREQIQRDQETIERALAGSGELTLDVLGTVGAVQASPELEKALADLAAKRAELRVLLQQYTDLHRPVRQLRAEIETLETRTIPRLATQVVENLQTRASILDTMIGAASTELQEIPPRAIEEARLRRHVAIAENLYNSLQSRFEEARLAAETSIPDIRILDRATVPHEPVTDKRLQVILLAMAGSLALAVLGAILLDRLDPRVRYPEQVARDMRLTILGAVPQVNLKDGAMPAEEEASVLEALRGIRLNLIYAHGTSGPLLVTISSPGSGDGKSFLVSNLALAFADLGRRTLAIDGDTRRGELHRLLGGTRKPGLTDFLAGRATVEEIIQPTSYGSLDFIGGGTRMHHAPELLASRAMRDLLADARSRYDVVLIDSPPLGAGIDPLVLGAATGHLLMVVRTGKTERAFAEAKLQLLDRLPVRVLGAVLNGVEMQDGIYRYYSYLSGYESKGEALEGGGEESPPRLQGV